VVAQPDKDIQTELFLRLNNKTYTEHKEISMMEEIMNVELRAASEAKLLVTTTAKLYFEA